MSSFVLGHRGDSANHAENTLAAFEAAIRCGADGVELDVQCSADGVAVVMHDDTLDRTTAGSGKVDAQTWPQLDALGVPRLEQALEALRGHIVAVELKPPYGMQPNLAAHVLTAVREMQMAPAPWLLSFDHRHLAAARRHDGTAVTAALVRERPRNPVAVLDACRADLLACWWEHVDTQLCEKLRAHGRSVIAWTVDGEDDALRLASLGVWAVISNRPCALAAPLRLLRGGAQ